MKMEYQKIKEVRRSKSWNDGYKEGVRDGKQMVKQSREEKRENRIGEIRRQEIEKLRNQFKEIFGFLTSDEVREEIERHEKYYHEND